MIASGYFSPEQPDLFKPIIDSLLNKGDYYMVLADYEDYISCQEKVTRTYRDTFKWTKMSILNVANMGKFSSDRTIREYLKDIWKSKPISIVMKHPEIL